jgi:virginiamycin B lyase
MSRRVDSGGRMAWAILCALLALAAVGVAGARAAEGTVEYEIGGATRASGMTLGPDGDLWFVAARYLDSPSGAPGDVVGRLTPGGRASEFSMPPRAMPAGGQIASGHDGNLWFTAPAADAVGRVTPLGQIQEYPLPESGSAPGAIVAGPGGAVWFVEEAADRVGRITAAGAITEYPLPVGAHPTGIAEGPDGALWIAESGLGRIARMSAAGVVTEYALPDPDGIPHAIVSAADGNLWFSEERRPRVGRISPAGEVTEFQIPSDRGTRELIVDGAGDLWFTTGYAIGSISTDGAVGEPACVERSCRLPVNAIAKGPDGGVWFAGGLRQTGGGGGTALLELGSPGIVGRFAPPSLSARIGRGASKVSGGLTTVAISCHGGGAGQACAGALKLSAKIGGRNVVLSRHRYRLEPTTGRRLPMGVGFRGAALLSRRGKLVARLTATLDGGAAASRKLVLRARGRKR